MANCSLSDDAQAFNPSGPSSSIPSPNISDLEDVVEDNLSKAKALLAIAMWGEGLNSCSINIQHDYLSVLDDLIEKAMSGFTEIRKNKLT